MPQSIQLSSSPAKRRNERQAFRGPNRSETILLPQSSADLGMGHQPCVVRDSKVWYDTGITGALLGDSVDADFRVVRPLRLAPRKERWQECCTPHHEKRPEKGGGARRLNHRYGLNNAVYQC
jgi:hypothetical protein